ncbi:unnamed protein product, partial [marine sediment metagenome]
SAWRAYTKGEATSGIILPKGLQKNQKLEDIILTPSTKAESGHDIYISRDKILNDKIVDKEIYEQIEEASYKLFKFAQDYCYKNGLILVDTKVLSNCFLIISSIFSVTMVILKRKKHKNSYYQFYAVFINPRIIK